MPVRPRPSLISCPKCGWSYVFAPPSDAIPPGMLHTQCPKCGNTELERKPAGAISQLLAELGRCVGLR